MQATSSLVSPLLFHDQVDHAVASCAIVSCYMEIADRLWVDGPLGYVVYVHV